MNLLEYLQYYFTRLSSYFSAITPRNIRIHTENNNESEEYGIFSVLDNRNDSITDQEQDQGEFCDQNTNALYNTTNTISALVGKTGS